MTDWLRGEIWSCIIPGAYGKPRPVVICQNSRFGAHTSVSVLPLTSHVHDTPLYRCTLEPGDGTGLDIVSQIMIDKLNTVPVEKLGEKIGTVPTTVMQQVDRNLAVFLGIAA